MTNRDTEIVSRIRARLEQQLGEDRFELWFGNGTWLHWTNEGLQVSADTSFRVDRLRRGLLGDIQRVLWEECDRDVAVTFDVNPSLSGNEPIERAGGPSEDAAKTCQEHTRPTEAVTGSTKGGGAALAIAPELRTASARSASWSGRTTPPRRFARLDGLVAGACNRMALGAAELVIRDPGQMNPLFVHGPSGAGKTHLLEGIWSEVRRCGGRRIIYLTAEQFTTYFLQALRGSGLPNFRQKYRAVDLLILDDVQFFVGKQATINELLHTLDALLRDSGQIVMSADRPPSELAVLGAELQARISGGLVCPMQPLDVDTRRRLVSQLVQRREMTLDNASLDRIAERVPGDARQIVGVVNRLWATGQTLDRPPTLAMVDEVLGELFPNAGGVIKLDDIQRVVCEEFGLDPDVLRSDRRAHSVSHPRMLAMWLARKYTQAALTEIGEFFGRRSHSTVLSAQHKVERWVTSGQTVKCDKSNCDVRALLTRLERSLRA